ncbi:hypothetical protein L9F63_026975, partial [Diploptera punctata]
MAPVLDAYSTGSVPESWLNKKFLENALQEAYKQPKLKIIEYDVKAAVGKGENYCSDLYRVSVHSSDGKMSRLIVKEELKEGKFAKIVNDSTAFCREIQMYSTTAVQLFNILDKAVP